MLYSSLTPAPYHASLRCPNSSSEALLPSSMASSGTKSKPKWKPFIRTTSRRAVPKLSASAESDSEVDQFLENSTISDFMRFQKDDGGGGTGELQTAVVSYKRRLPCFLLNPFLQVDLVSTIRIADKQYVEILQKGLKYYDCVLYEMVASRESLENRKNSTSTKRLKASRSKGFNILGFIQRQMANILSLDFQLDCLDHEDDNCLHADLDYETFFFTSA